MARAIAIPELSAPREPRQLFLGYAAIKRIAERTGLPFNEAFARLWRRSAADHLIVNAHLLVVFLWAALHREHPRQPDTYLWVDLGEEPVAALVDAYCSGGPEPFFDREATLLMRLIDAAYQAGLLRRPAADGTGAEEARGAPDPPTAVDGTTTP